MLDTIDLSQITAITTDSRAAIKDSLFIAIKGQNHDGHDYVHQAIQNGTKIIISEHPVAFPNGRNIVVPNTRIALSRIAARFYGQQPENIVAVTGTNGKSSIVTFTEQIWKALGYNAASLGTLSGGLTSPDAITLHQTLNHYAQNGITHLALEASSHGLDQHRMDSIALKAAGFSNLSRDHLDYHSDMKAYLAAKARLFNDVMMDDGIAVLNADAPEYEALKAQSKGRVISYGYKGEHLRIIKITPDTNNIEVDLEIFGHAYNVKIPLIGTFQLSNILCALGLSFLSAQPSKELVMRSVKTIKTIKPVRGRLQPVFGHPEKAQIYIDYAHTPDALETVLKTVRSHTKGKVYCVFGCGGDRDKGKRPIMGRIAFDCADTIIITDDNPRSEKPVDIRNEILCGIPKSTHTKIVLEIGDRAAAIDYSIQSLYQYDTLVIAGKGHETGQSLESGFIEFDDYIQAEKAIKKMLVEDKK
jgi:UDP-N-acetylmuramoyl-L-alanyl-D-glutamate--2,6-diaminopimelate ligase